MTKKYEKPMALVNNDLAESVYMASGEASNTCYSPTVTPDQTPAPGRNTYTFRIRAPHNGDHTTNQQEVIISFNEPVTFIRAENNQCISGDNSTTLHISCNRFNNGTDNFEFLLEVQAVQEVPNLSVTGCVIVCGGVN